MQARYIEEDTVSTKALLPMIYNKRKILSGADRMLLHLKTWCYWNTPVFYI